MQARVIRPDTVWTDRRRVAAAFLSSVVPGLGQAFNRDLRFIVVFGLPLLTFLAIGLGLWSAFQARLLPSILRPDTVLSILLLNGILLGWRLVSVGHAFLAGASGPIGRLGAVGLAIVAAWTVVPQVAGGYLGWRV